jgi:hypothetical protein
MAQMFSHPAAPKQRVPHQPNQQTRDRIRSKSSIGNRRTRTCNSFNIVVYAVPNLFKGGYDGILVYRLRPATASKRSRGTVGLAPRAPRNLVFGGRR